MYSANHMLFFRPLQQSPLGGVAEAQGRARCTTSRTFTARRKPGFGHAGAAKRTLARRPGTPPYTLAQRANEHVI